MGAAATTRARFTLGVTGVVMLLLCMAAAPARASKSEWSLFEDHTALVQSGVKKRISTLNEIKGLGADTLRIEFKWNEIAPKPQDKTKPKFDAADPAAYAGALDAFPGFGQYDDLVQRATAMGFRILITITGDAPRWATAGGKGSSFATANWGVSAGEYGKFASAVAKRYSGKFGGLPAVYYYSIWNEPNHKQFIKPQSSAPRSTAGSWTQACRRSAPTGRRPRRCSWARPPPWAPGQVIGPRAFFQKWLCLNKRFKRIKTGGCAKFKKVDADGYAHHPYGPVDLVPKKADIINLLRFPARLLPRCRRAGGPPARASPDLRHRVRTPVEPPTLPSARRRPVRRN